MSDKLIVALDYSDLKEAEKIVKKISPLVKNFKVGKELFTSAGPQAVKMVQAYKGRVFLDLKFHDIPNTVGSACQAAAELGVWMLNVHASGGKNMMIAAVQSVHKTAQAHKITPPIILGVTVLTSMQDHDLKEVGVAKKVKEQVPFLAKLCKSCGLDGVVASGQEIGLIRKAAGPGFLIITPGVRPVWASHGDQKRIITPKEAVDSGADYIVVGRPVTQHPQPIVAVEKILKEISS